VFREDNVVFSLGIADSTAEFDAMQAKAAAETRLDSSRTSASGPRTIRTAVTGLRVHPPLSALRQAPANPRWSNPPWLNPVNGQNGEMRYHAYAMRNAVRESQS